MPLVRPCDSDREGPDIVRIEGTPARVRSRESSQMTRLFRRLEAAHRHYVAALHVAQIGQRARRFLHNHVSVVFGVNSHSKSARILV